MNGPPLHTDGVTPAGFRSLMSEFPTGVAIVTAFDAQDQPCGMTCSSLCSLSVLPPALLMCLRTGSPTLNAITWRGMFAVNLLHGDAYKAAELFGSGTPGRFALVPWGAGDCGPHLTEHAHAIAGCKVSRTMDGGTHTVVFAEVGYILRKTGLTPLLYGRRTYRSWQE
jgi:flavin reductase (NADH)